MLRLSHRKLKTIKITFNAVLITIIAFCVFREAFYSIPDDWLFFVTSDAVENFLCASIGYGLYYFVFELKGIRKKLGFIFLFVMVLVLLASIKDYRIHDRIETEQTFEYLTGFLGRSLLFYSLIFFIDRLEFFNRYKNMEKELNQAKERLLRNRLHPHFLFNAFNSLYSLSLNNHPETSEYILKLSSMMRYLTDETHVDKVPLKKELDFIEKLIAIEKIRFGKDARIDFVVEDSDTLEKFIAPFLLITLVENAFKHGFYTNSKDAFVKINVKIANDVLLFTSENTLTNKQHFQKNTRKGKGLDTLRQRLQLLYPKRSTIKIDTTEGIYRTHLKLRLG